MFIIGSFTSFSMMPISRLDPYSLLTEEDLHLMLEDNFRPAVSFPQTGKEFYNEWHCYKTDRLKLSLGQIDYDGIKESPTIIYETEKEIIEFGIDPDENWDSKKIQTNWRELIEERKFICLFSVHLYIRENYEFRYIEQIKTETGRWSRSDEEFLLEEE
jgi:hypothetical protein